MTPRPRSAADRAISPRSRSRRLTVDEITLFKEIQPPPPADAPRMREAARARLTAAANGAPGHPARPRRRTVLAVASAAALAAAGTSYGLAAVGGSPSA